MRFSYGVSVGPESVAFHFVMSVSDGKAEMPGVGDIIRVMSSDWRLQNQLASISIPSSLTSNTPFDNVAIVCRSSWTAAFNTLVDGRHRGRRRIDGTQSICHRIVGAGVLLLRRAKVRE